MSPEATSVTLPELPPAVGTTKTSCDVERYRTLRVYQHLSPNLGSLEVREEASLMNFSPPTLRRERNLLQVPHFFVGTLQPL